MTARDRLAALDRQLLPGSVPQSSGWALRWALLAYALVFAVAVALGVLVSVLVDELGAAVSGGFIGLAGAFVVSRLFLSRDSAKRG